MRRPNDLDYIKYVSSGMMGYALNNSRKADLEAISKMPEGKAANHLYLGLGNLGFKEASAEWGITGKGLSNGAIYCDLNNDGRLDLVINSLNAEPVILKNCTPVDKHNYIRIKFKGNEGNRYGTGARVKVWAGGKLFYRQLQPTRGFESSVEPVLHLGLGACTAADSILVIWPDGSYEKSGKTRAQQTIEFRKTGAGGKYNFNLAHKGSNANPGLLSLLPVSTQPVTFLHKENDFTDYNTQPLLPFSLSNEGPHLAIDKDLIYICAASGQKKNIYRLGNNLKYHAVQQLDSATLYEDTDAVFADFTGDGISDLLVSSGGNEASPDSKLLSLRLYPGKPGGSFGKPRFPLPGFRETVSCLRLQKDGSRILLCIGSRAVSGAYGLLPANHLVEVKNNTWHDITMERAPVLNTIGMVSDAQFCDINKDGNSDLVLVGDWMPVTILLNKIKSFEDVTSSYNLGATTGLWRSLSCSDLDGDGKRDIVAGNYGLNNRYRPSINYPLSMYAADFGGSGQVKQVLASWKMNNYYPINSKDELSKQMPFLNRRYESYRSFAGQPVDSVFTQAELKMATRFNAKTLATTVFFQTKQHGFEPVILPPEAQFSPVFSI